MDIFIKAEKQRRYQFTYRERKEFENIKDYAKGYYFSRKMDELHRLKKENEQTRAELKEIGDRLRKKEYNI